MIPGQSAILHAAAVPGGKTYEQFVAHLGTLPTTRFVDWSGSTYGLSGSAGTVGRYLPNQSAGGGNGVMSGTSWFDGTSPATFDDVNTNVGASIVHGLYTQADVDRQKANIYAIYVVIEIVANVFRAGLTRHGLTSSGTPVANRKMTKIIYWDGTRPMTNNPSLGTPPEPYDWTIP